MEIKKITPKRNGRRSGADSRAIEQTTRVLPPTTRALFQQGRPITNSIYSRSQVRIW